MKKLIFGMLTIGALFTSCGEDEPACTADDYVGTYTGTVNCPGDDVETATLIVSKISNSQISLVDNDGFVFLLDVVECEAKGSITEDGDLYSVTLNYSDQGFSFVGEITEDGNSYTCTGNFTK